MIQNISEDTVDKIDLYLKDNCLKRIILQKIIQQKQSTISSIFSHKRKLKLEEYVLITNYFKLPFEYFLNNEKEDSAIPPRTPESS